ncbi:glycine dehydrogenase (aminomethyl-transferring) [Candidatus Woesearchaeota archaeon]|jgi:glycine dehydrogenase subunit 2|nr:glycine dehydrogenase (aminomethyl-transferring) [Candidatus Woesearchaeota archaeon]|tara:strand:- start:6506 stop:7951 length:1446 start_codon:yes stop_codon:yes gene_type:complete
MKLIFEISKKGRKAVQFPELDVPEQENLLPQDLLRGELELPEVSEVDIIRHYTALSRRNFGVDNGFYPLGSCTMKYNPKINEDSARLNGFAQLHPYTPENLSQGALQIMYELEQYLMEITGMDQFTLQPAAGSHGELTGMMIVKKYFEGINEKRSKILIPDSAHGTNPASVTLCGFESVEVKSNDKGEIDLEDLKSKLNKDVAAIMLTNPNTLGLFETQILEITKAMHQNGSLVYMDGANLNAMVGITKPGDFGIDILHVNLHKTFSTPHGGGGPGSGPVGVTKELSRFLPRPKIEFIDNKYKINYNMPDSIGRVRAFYGNFGILVRAYTYIRSNGFEGIRAVGENSVLNANYLLSKLKKHYHVPFNRICQHEFILTDKNLSNGVTTNDLAKRLLDFGVHAPTIYFPLIVHGAIMIEPTETESKETLDRFAEIMMKIKEESEKEPETVKAAPLATPVSKLDNVLAARKPVLKFEDKIIIPQ